MQKLDDESGGQRINHGHAEDDHERVMGRKGSFSRLIQTERILEHIHLNEDNRAGGTGFCQIRSLSASDVRSVGKNKGDKGDADIPRIGKHRTVLKGFFF